MIANWLAELLLPGKSNETDELSVYFDFALSTEMKDWLYAPHAADRQKNNSDVAAAVLDEHELI
ncbi:MAG: hypothetical protein ACXWF8_12010 [Methylobacter sp.]